MESDLRRNRTRLQTFDSFSLNIGCNDGLVRKKEQSNHNNIKKSLNAINNVVE